MSALSIQPTYPIFTDIDGQPLENGFVWIGQPNLDPQTNPISAYWDAALTIPASQPIRTLAGYPANSGTTARLYVNSDYSIRVMNKKGSVVYSAPAATERYNGAVVGGVDASEVTYLPAGTGAVVTDAQRKLSESVSVSDFGASPSALADVNTAAIQAAADYCEANGAFLQGAPGTYATNGTLTLKCSGDLSEMTINTNGTTVSPCIRVGEHVGSTFTQSIDLKLPKCNNTAHVAGDGWATYGSNVGVSLDNLLDSVIYAPWATGFGVGVYSGGVNFGNSYNQITVGYIADNKVNLKIGPKATGGWSNANTYHIGRCRHSGGETNGGVPFSGSRNIFLDSCNDNLLLKPTIEGSTAATEFTLELYNANYNTIIQPRWENGASGGASTMKIRLEGVSPSVCSGNLILGGYEFGASLAYTIVGACDNNTKLGAGRGDQSFSVQNPIAINNPTGDGLNQPHWQGFSSAINPLGKSASATDYNYRFYANGIDGKRSTDGNPRVRINWSTAGVYLGAGGTNPLTYGMTMLGTGGLAVNSDWMPATTNTHDLGISTYRWQDCFLVNAPNVSSDANTKQQVRELSDVESLVAVKCKGLLRAYKLNSAVAQKGDKARIHFGAIAQDVKAAFESEGLDPFAYGLLCYDEWEDKPEELDDDGVISIPAVPAGNLYSLRYEELLAFIIAAM